MMKRLVLVFALLTAAAPVLAALSEVNVGASLTERGLLLTALIVFAGGVAVSLTPCVYPMIPITLGIIGARSAGQKPIIGFLRSSVFVLGIAAVYTALGFFAVRTGRTFGFVFQNAWFIAFIALFFVAMGLSMLDLFTIQMPASLAGKLQSGANRGGYVGAFLLGLVTGVVASPCGSPVLLGVLAIAAESGRGAVGVTLLFSYALGLGLLFLVLGTFPAFLHRMPKSGVWMEDVKKALGLVLIGVGVYYSKLALPETAFWVVAAVAALAGAVVVAIFAGKRAGFPVLQWSWRGAGILMLGFAVYAAVPKTSLALLAANDTSRGSTPPVESPVGQDSPSANGAKTQAGSPDAGAATPAPDPNAPPTEWLTDEAAALELAASINAPVMIDFTAAWCAACKQLDRQTFSQPRVQEALSRFIRVKIDCTEQTDENAALQRKYGALSLPTVAFVTPDGEILKDLSLYKFEPPDAFIERLNRVPR
jgi:thiol:disulfide interchange protein DsbD